MQLRAVFTSSNTRSGRNVVAADGPIIRYIPFPASSEQRQVPRGSCIAQTGPHIKRCSRVKISECEICVFPVQNIGCISGSCHFAAAAIFAVAAASNAAGSLCRKSSPGRAVNFSALPAVFPSRSQFSPSNCPAVGFSPRCGLRHRPCILRFRPAVVSARRNRRRI